MFNWALFALRFFQRARFTVPCTKPSPFLQFPISARNLPLSQRFDSRTGSFHVKGKKSLKYVRLKEARKTHEESIRVPIPPPMPRLDYQKIMVVNKALFLGGVSLGSHEGAEKTRDYFINHSLSGSLLKNHCEFVSQEKRQTYVAQCC